MVKYLELLGYLLKLAGYKVNIQKKNCTFYEVK